MLARLFAVALAVAIAGAGVQLEAATIVIVNRDPPGVGFNDSTPATPVGGNSGITVGQQRLNAFVYAASIWGPKIHSRIPIRVVATFGPLTPCTAEFAVLGSAGPTGWVASSALPQANTWYPIALAGAITGTDYAVSFPDQAHVAAQFNGSIGTPNCLPSSRWYLGFDRNFDPDTQIDFVTVLLHELAHGLGVSGNVDLDTGALSSGLPDIFSRFVYDNTVLMRWSAMSDAQRLASITNAGNVVWDGSSATAGATILVAGTDVSGRPKLYTPNPAEPGSSVWHYDVSASPNLLMEPAINDGLTHGVDLPDDLTLPLLRDLGWQPVAAAPCYTLTTAVSPAGAGAVSPLSPFDCANGYSAARELTLFAQAASGYAFERWTSGVGGSFTGSTSAANARYTISGNASVTATFVAVSPPSELLVNGGFEEATATGNSAPGWTVLPFAGHNLILDSGPYPHSGSNYAVLGVADNSTDAVRQTVTIPADVTSAALEAWVNVTTQETGGTWDKLYFDLHGTSGTLLRTLGFISNADASRSGSVPGGYFKVGPFDLLPNRGQTVQIGIRAANDSSAPTTFLLDDVSLRVSVPVGNHAPVANDQSITVPEDDPGRNITLTATDADGDPLTFRFFSGDFHGHLMGTPPHVTYAPAPNYHGTDNFTFKANDGTADSNVGTVTITVTPVNDAPVAQGQSLTTQEDTAIPVTLAATDADGDEVTYAIATVPAHGTLGGSAPNLVYAPASGYRGADSFTFTATDGTAISTATVTITVGVTNEVPVAQSRSITTSEDSAVSAAVTATDADGDALTYTIVTPPAQGTLLGTPPDLTYNPSVNFHGTDGFTFQADDGRADSNVATVTITVTPVNDAPVAQAQTVATAEDTSANITMAAADVDGDPLTYAIVTSPGHGTLTNAPPNVTYVPAPNHHGADSFTFHANDGAASSNVATVTLSVGPVNDTPIAQGQSLTTQQDAAIPVTLVAMDADNDTLTYALATAPAHGTVSGTAPDLVYTPAPGYHGPDSFTFTATDGTAISNAAIVSIVVVAANEPPVAQSRSVTTPEDYGVNTVVTATDANGDALTYTIVTPPAHGTLIGTAPDLAYSPPVNFHGTDSFTFQAHDGKAASNVATVTVTVTPMNDPPVAQSQPTITMTEDVPKEITLSATDVDGDALTYIIVRAPVLGTLTGTGPHYLYTPAPDHYGPASLRFQVNDGTLDSNIVMVSISIGAVNDAPVAVSGSVTASEDMSTELLFSGSDPDVDRLTFTVLSGPSHGTVEGTMPVLFYTPAADYHGPDSVTFRASDGVLESNVATISIAVTPMNDRPTAHHQEVVLAEDTSKAIVTTAHDIDGDPLTWTLVRGPAYGTLSGTLPNVFYTPDPNYAGADGFDVAVSDGTETSFEAWIRIDVTAVNDPPVVTNHSTTTLEDQPVSTHLSATDVDDRTFTWTVVEPPAHGTLQNDPPFLTYWPAANYHGTDSFTFRANDGAASSEVATYSIAITPVNDTPIALPQNVATSEDTPVAIVVGGTDIDGDALTYIVTRSPQNGTLTGTPPNFTYVPQANLSGGDWFRFTANDAGATSAEAVVEITIEHVNDPPVAEPQSVTSFEDVPKWFTLEAADIDTERPDISFSIVTQPVHGTVSLSGRDAAYTPPPNYHGSDSFTFRASDGSLFSAPATVSLVVQPVNDRPLALRQDLSTPENTSKPIVLTGTDADGDVLTFRLLNNPSHGTLAGTPPSLTYTPKPDYVGVDGFLFVASDGTEESAFGEVFITMTNVNNPPVAESRSLHTNACVAVPVLLDATDADGEPLTYGVVAHPVHGTLSGSPPSLSYMPSGTYSGSDSFTFRASDGIDFSNVATVSLTIAANTPPTLGVYPRATARQGQTITVAPSAAPSDAVGVTKVTASISHAHGGAVSVSPATGVVTITHAGTPGTYQVTVTAADTCGASATASFVLDVLPAPVFVSFTATARLDSTVALRWNVVDGATDYVVLRRGIGGGFVPIGVTAAAEWIDGVASQTAYAYRIEARETGRILSSSPVDYVSTFRYTDVPITSSTRVRARHVEELRPVAAALCQLAGVAVPAWTGDALAGTRIRAVHLTELRDALNAVRDALSLPAAAFVDATLSGVKVKRVHVNELRSHLKSPQ